MLKSLKMQRGVLVQVSVHGTDSAYRLQQRLIDVRDLPESTLLVRDLPVPCVVDHGHQPALPGKDSPGFQSLMALMRQDGWRVKLSGAYRISTHPDYAGVNPARLYDFQGTKCLS